MPQPTLKQLTHFLALAETQHFGRAAARCHVSQSALSTSIRELETVLETILVDRTTRQVRLTAIGHEVLQRGQTIMAELTALTTLTRQKAEPLTGSLRLGVIPTIGPYLLPKLMPRLRRSFPKLKLYLREDLTDRLLAELDAGQLDLVLLALPYQLGNLQSRSLAEDPFLLCCPDQHPLAGSAQITPAQLRQEKLLLLADGHCLRQHALDACRLRGKNQIGDFAATSLYTVVQMVAGGLGLTLVPQLAVTAGLTKNLPVAVRPLSNRGAVREIGVVWRKSGLREEEVHLLADEIQQLTQEHH